MSDILTTAPVWICVATGLLVMVLDLLSGRDAAKGFLGFVTAAGLTVAGVVAVIAWPSAPALEAPYLAGLIRFDAWTAFFGVLALFSAAAAALVSVRYLPGQACDDGEHSALLALSASGALVLVAALDLIVLFLGLEIMSLAVYVLAAGKRSSPCSAEAGMKYFVLGGVASAFLLFGAAFLYGATGSLRFSDVASHFVHDVPSWDRALVTAAFVLVSVGLAFKVAAAPFHAWTPDVYEGAPTHAVVYMAGAIKAAAFAVLARVLFATFGAPGVLSGPLGLPELLLGLAVASMLIGNVLGIVQTNVKRILAYSSIAHAGYVLLGLWSAAAASPGVDLPASVPFYLLSYVAATVGAFAIVAQLGADGNEDLSLDRLSGLGRRRPVLAALLLVCLLSLAGVPPLAGFAGKFLLFGDVLAAGDAGGEHLAWVLFAVGNSLVALYYYLRIVVYLYFREPEAEPAPVLGGLSGGFAATVAVLVVLWAGMAPGLALKASAAASAHLIPPAEVAAADRAPTAGR